VAWPFYPPAVCLNKVVDNYFCKGFPWSSGLIPCTHLLGVAFTAVVGISLVQSSIKVKRYKPIYFERALLQLLFPACVFLVGTCWAVLDTTLIQYAPLSVTMTFAWLLLSHTVCRNAI